MRIVIGNDHIVTDLKNKIRDKLINDGHDVLDVGTYDSNRTHYPIYGKRVAEEVVNNNFDFGIVICGTGVGIANAAQKIKGARVALISDIYSAIEAKRLYDVNILGFGGRITGIGIIEEAIDKFINTKFEGSPILIKYLDDIVSNKANKNQYFETELKKWKNGEYYD